MIISPKQYKVSNQRTRGFTLLEVLVALLVLSIGLLGLAMLQMTSLKFNTDSYFRTQATFHAYDIIDRIRANSTNAASYHVPDAAAKADAISDYDNCSSCDCDSNSCNGSDLAIYDLGTWYQKMDKVLAPIASKPTTIVVNGTQITVTINWLERDIEKKQIWDIEL